MNVMTVVAASGIALLVLVIVRDLWTLGCCSVDMSGEAEREAASFLSEDPATGQK